MADDSLIDRKKRAFLEFFGDNPKFFDLYGVTPFLHKYDELEQIAEKYRNWYKSTTSPTILNVPKELELPYKVHHNLSSEIQSRAELISKLTGKDINICMNEILSVRSIPIPIEDFNGSTIYTSTIYRGKTQVNTGTVFEKKVTEFIESIDDSITVKSGKKRGRNKFDKDIYLNDKYKLSAEISFQVTTNSVMERKSHLNIPKDLTVIMIFGGIGWIERINALERIISPESGYSACFGPSEGQFLKLKEYILSFE